MVYSAEAHASDIDTLDPNTDDSPRSCAVRVEANYSTSILVTSILFFVFGHFQDGPRGGWREDAREFELPCASA